MASGKGKSSTKGRGKTSASVSKQQKEAATTLATTLDERVTADDFEAPEPTHHVRELTVHYKISPQVKARAFQEYGFHFQSANFKHFGQKMAMCVNKVMETTGWLGHEYAFLLNDKLSRRQMRALKKEMVKNCKAQFPQYALNEPSKFRMACFVYDRHKADYNGDWRSYLVSAQNGPTPRSEHLEYSAVCHFYDGPGKFLAYGMKFMASYQILMSDQQDFEDPEALYNNCLEIMSTQIQSQPNYACYFQNEIRELAEIEASKLLPLPIANYHKRRTPGSVNQLYNVCRFLGIKTEMKSDPMKEGIRTEWNRLKTWHKNNISEKGKHDEARRKDFQWIADTELPLTDFELEAKQAKDQEKAEKQQRKEAKQAEHNAKKLPRGTREVPG